jgi:hypothetical protein
MPINVILTEDLAALRANIETFSMPTVTFLTCVDQLGMVLLGMVRLGLCIRIDASMPINVILTEDLAALRANIETFSMPTVTFLTCVDPVGLVLLSLRIRIDRRIYATVLVNLGRSGIRHIYPV